MLRKDLLDPAMQQKIRLLVSKIMIEDNLDCKAVLAYTGLSYTPYYEFILAGKLRGEKVVRAFAHFVVKHGYKLEE
jgi:hypothetical protein